MVHRVNVLGSAGKHGFAQGSVAYAWCNYVKDMKDLGRPDQSVHVRVGAAPSGALLEMLGGWDEERGEWRVFHAMRPRPGLMAFLGW